jgi:hypothetical protein
MTIGLVPRGGNGIILYYSSIPFCLSKKESKRTPSPQVFFRQGGKPAQKLRHPDASVGTVPIEAFFAYTSEKATHKLNFLLIFINYLQIMILTSIRHR